MFLRDTNALAERMVHGTAALSLGPNFDEGLTAYKNAGVVYDIRPLGFTADIASISTGYGIAAVINRSPHPNAGKVFINWLLSQPIQDALAKAVTSNSRRADVPPPFGWRSGKSCGAWPRRSPSASRSFSSALRRSPRARL